MKRAFVPGLFLLCLSTPGRADVIALSPDGASVVRVTPGASVNASSFNTSLLPSGYTATSGSTGSLSVTSYDAGFRNGSGGAQFTALYDTGLQASSNINWVQVINTNDPLGGNTSPYLDNAANTSQPFYSFTQENRDPNLPGNQLNFYDYSRRSPNDLATINPITWNADLYPVLVSGTSLTVENGTSWGWTLKKAPVGHDTAVFTNPTPATAVVSGVGTNSFFWGSGGDSSSLTFAGRSFDTTPNTVFDLGTLIYHNGTITSGSGADGVVFDVSLAFDNVPEKNFHLTTPFTLVNTPNTSDPIASADFVSIGNFGFTFHVLEGNTASVDVLAKLTTNLSGIPAGTDNADSPIAPGPFDPDPSYVLTLVGLANPSQGGFVVPEPSGILLLAFAISCSLFIGRKRLQLRR